MKLKYLNCEVGGCSSWWFQLRHQLIEGFQSFFAKSLAIRSRRSWDKSLINGWRMISSRLSTTTRTASSTPSRATMKSPTSPLSMLWFVAVILNQRILLILSSIQCFPAIMTLRIPFSSSMRCSNQGWPFLGRRVEHDTFVAFLILNLGICLSKRWKRLLS